MATVVQRPGGPRIPTKVLWAPKPVSKGQVQWSLPVRAPSPVKMVDTNEEGWGARLPRAVLESLLQCNKTPQNLGVVNNHFIIF